MKFPSFIQYNTKDWLSGGRFRISGNAFARVIPAAANRRGYAFICAGDGRYDRPGAGAVKKEPDFDRSKGDRYAL